MKRTYFRSASRDVYGPVRTLGTGLLVMILSLGLSASAKDGVPSDSAHPVPSVKPKAGVKSKRWFQIGVASWYGSKFQGRSTAGGERFDMYGMTCAHPSLPMGTWLRVTNLKNHKTALVRVNDRGPVQPDRIVDLSYEAARVLGLAGIGKVRLEPVNSSDPALELSMMAQLQMPMAILQPVR